MISRLKSFLATENRDTIERWARAHVSAVPMASGDTLCRVLSELMMVVTLEDLSVAPHLVMDGFWEIWNTICIARRVKSGWTSIDVGANFGYYSILLAKLTGASVEAWEPAEDLARYIDKSARLNGVHDQVRIVKLAASDSARYGKLERAGSDFGSAMVSELADGESSHPHYNTQRGGIVRMPLQFERLDFRRDAAPDFVKIDAEGHEPEIWRGMQGLFEAGKPKAILLEWSPSKYADPKAFLGEIGERGYSVRVVDPTGELQAPVGDITAIEGHLDLWLER